MNKKVLALMFFFVFFSCALFANNAFGQENVQPLPEEKKQTPSSVPDKKPEELKTISPDMVIAKVEATNAELKEVKDREYEASFEIYNDESYQPQIISSLVLVKNSQEGQAVYQKVTSPDEITLGPKKTKLIKMSFIPADFLDGDFQLYADIRNKAGTELAVRFLGDINLKKNLDWIELEKDSCKIKANDKSYDESKMAIAEKDSTISISCIYKNNSTQSKKIFPQINAKTGSDFGDQAADEKGNEVSFASNEKKEISFPEFKNTFSKNLAVSATLENENGKPVSRPWESHVHFSEPAFLIANLRSDKDYYQKGETAELIFTPELGFSGTPNLEIAIEDKDGKSCIDPQKQTKVMELIKGKASFNWKIPISHDCIDPKITAEIKEPAGRVVGESTYIIRTSEESLAGIKKEKEVKTNENKKRALWFIPVIMLFLAFFILRIGDKKKLRDKYILPVIALAFILGLTGGVNRAQGMTAVDRENFLTLTMSLSKDDLSLPSDTSYTVSISLDWRYNYNWEYNPASKQYEVCGAANPYPSYFKTLPNKLSGISVDTLASFDGSKFNLKNYDDYDDQSWEWYWTESNWKNIFKNVSINSYGTIRGSQTYQVPRFFWEEKDHPIPYQVRLKVNDFVYLNVNGELVSKKYCGKAITGHYRDNVCDSYGESGSYSIPACDSWWLYTLSGTMSLKEDGVCSDKKSFVNEPPPTPVIYGLDPLCKYGKTDTYSGNWDSRAPYNGAFHYEVVPKGTDTSGKVDYKCQGIENSEYQYYKDWNYPNWASASDTDCSINVKLDGTCGYKNNQPYCSVNEPNDSPGACDNKNWDFPDVSNVAQNIVAGSGTISWTCLGIGGGSSENCQTTPGAMAKCGLANGVPSEREPYWDLCERGDSSEYGWGGVSLREEYDPVNERRNQYWSWNCDMYTESGSSLLCSVPCRADKLPECLSNATNLRYYDKLLPVFSWYGSDSFFCKTGTVDINRNRQLDASEFSGDGINVPWTWYCRELGYNGAIVESSGQCQAKKIEAGLLVTYNGNTVTSGGTITVPAGEKVTFDWWSQNANANFRPYPGVTGCVAYTVDSNNYDRSGAESDWKTCTSQYPSNCIGEGSSFRSSYYTKPVSGSASFVPKDLTYYFMCRAYGTGSNETDAIWNPWTATSSVNVTVTVPSVPANCGLATSERHCALNDTSPKLCDTTSSSLEGSVTLVNNKFTWTCKSNTGGADATCKAEKYCTTDSVWREMEPQ